MNEKERYYTSLRENGYRITNQRKAVIDVLYEYRKEHLTVDEIFEILKNKKSDIGLATLYRNVHVLNRLGILEKITFDNESTRYELAYDGIPLHHHHLICKQCGKVIEVEMDLLPMVRQAFEDSHGFMVENHRAKFYGLCEACR